MANKKTCALEKLININREVELTSAADARTDYSLFSLKLQYQGF